MIELLIKIIYSNKYFGLQLEYASSISVDHSNIGLLYHSTFQSLNSFESAFKSKNSEYNSKSLAYNSELVYLLGSKEYSEDINFFMVNEAFFFIRCPFIYSNNLYLNSLFIVWFKYYPIYLPYIINV